MRWIPLNIFCSIVMLFLCICCHCDQNSTASMLLNYLERGQTELAVWRKDYDIPRTRNHSCQDAIIDMLRRDRLPDTDMERNCANVEEIRELSRSGRLGKQLLSAFLEEDDLRRLSAGEFYSLEVSDLQAHISYNYQAIENYTLYAGAIDAPDVFDLAVLKKDKMFRVCQCTKLSHQAAYKCSSDCPESNVETQKSNSQFSLRFLVLTGSPVILLGICLTRRICFCYNKLRTYPEEEPVLLEERILHTVIRQRILLRFKEPQKAKRKVSKKSHPRFLQVKNQEPVPV